MEAKQELREQMSELNPWKGQPNEYKRTGKTDNNWGM